MTPLRRPFFARSVLDVAPDLLGCVIESRVGGDVGGDKVAIRLTEVEAYAGTDDPASHAFRGPTPRTAVMFGPAGHLYVYFTYGMHWCANIVTGTDGAASAVLLRAGEVVSGIDTARDRRAAARVDRDLARGPARLAEALGLLGSHSGVDLCARGALIRVRAQGPAENRSVLSGPRVGVTGAADRPWRYWLPGEPTVSVYRPAKPRTRS